MYERQKIRHAPEPRCRPTVVGLARCCNGRDRRYAVPAAELTAIIPGRATCRRRSAGSRLARASSASGGRRRPGTECPSGGRSSASARMRASVRRQPGSDTGLAHRRLRRRHHDALQVQVLGHRDLVGQRGRDHIRRGEAREVGEVVLVCREVVDRVDAPQEVREQVSVADVALVEVDVRGQILGSASGVHRAGQPVEHNHVVAECKQPVAVCSR